MAGNLPPAVASIQSRSAASTSKNEELIAQAKKLDNVPWCDEYERMISGMLYNCMNPDLVEGRHRIRRLASRYSQYIGPDGITATELTEQRTAMLQEMLGSVGKGTYIEPPFFLDYGCNTVVGEGFYSNFNLTILDCSLVTIGDRVLLGPSVSIITATHETSLESRRAGIEFAREITIGDDCWIGANAVILPGVNIGEGCTIGAGSIVTRDIPAFSVAMGAPARVVKKVEPYKEKAEEATGGEANS